MVNYVPEFHHTKDCEVEFRGQTDPSPNSKRQAVRTFWCNTHKQWTHNFPISVTYHYIGDVECIHERENLVPLFGPTGTYGPDTTWFCDDCGAQIK